MNFLYNTGIRLYAAAAGLASLRSRKIETMLAGQKRALQDVKAKIRPEDNPVWIHVASLGEFEQGRPLIERLKKEHPDKKIVLSFFSPSGYEVRKNYDKVDCVLYLPFDTPENARNIVDAINPSVAIFVKYEFWGNYLKTLARKEVPTYIISAIFRPGQAFFKPYGGMMRDVLGCFTHLYVQDEPSRELLGGIGISNVTVAGDTRFDRVTDIMAQRLDIPGLDTFGADIVFGSSWQQDEQFYIPWLNNNPDIRFIIAPHEFDNERISSLVDSVSGRIVTFSQWEKAVADGEDVSDVRGIIVDCFGKLSSLYRYGKMAYIGGGFGAGIHNINEAAVYAIPVVFGPKFSKFKEARDLVKIGGAYSCNTGSEVSLTLQKLVSDTLIRERAGKVAGKYIQDNLGATDIIYNDIFK